jgi:hypothetical protein
MLKELVLVVCNVVKECSCGFQWTRNYTGTLFTSGFSFNIPTPKIVNAFEAGDNRKAVAILDFKDWAKTGYHMVEEDTGYFNRKYIPRKEAQMLQGFKLDQS